VSGKNAQKDKGERMKTIRVAIVGQGRSGRGIHGACLSKDPERYRIVAVSDPLEDRRKRAVAEYGCEAYADYRELIQRKDLDLVINTTPSHLHVPVTMEFLKAGFNVLCEKPLARRAAEVDKLIAASKKVGKLLAIFQQSRYAPHFRQVQKVIDSGVLGRIVQISMSMSGFSRRWDWQTLQKNNGGSLLNTGPHPLDQALVLFGEGMPRVTCFMDRANTFGDAEDYVKLILSGAGHPVIDLEISSCQAYSGPAFVVQGTRGGMKATTGAAEWRYFKLSEAPKQKLIRTPIVNAEGLPAYVSETLNWHTGKWEVPPEQADMYSYMAAEFYRNLYRTLTAGAPLEITLQQVRRQIAVIEECQRQNPKIYKSRKRKK
jgi:predicted dehydrogenase